LVRTTQNESLSAVGGELLLRYASLWVKEKRNREIISLRKILAKN